MSMYSKVAALKKNVVSLPAKFGLMFPLRISLSHAGNLTIQYSKLQRSKILGPPLLIVTTALILPATGILWSSCCKLSELSFSHSLPVAAR